MRVFSIGTYSAIAHRGGKRNIPPQEAKVVQAAKKELETIESQGQKAGTDSAWWRYEFPEAMAALKTIASNEQLPEVQQSSLMSFHNFDDDGFI